MGSYRKIQKSFEKDINNDTQGNPRKSRRVIRMFFQNTDGVFETDMIIKWMDETRNSNILICLYIF